MAEAGWYQVRIDRGVVTVVLHGEFDLLETTQLDGALTPLIHPYARIAVDLSDVQFFGSSALRVLLDVRHRSLVVGASFHIVNPSRCCRALFDIAGVAEELSLTGPGLDHVRG